MTPTKKSSSSEDSDIAVIKNDIGYIKQDVAEIKRMQQSHYVSKEEFEPIKRLVYGLVGLILTGVVVTLLSLVVVK